ncbi:hypothetical protein KFL_000870210 [Klebsormidium nitens]|uniref:Uncharacterized protein n=1 Tax=Klebsormidium nitens TaxID=105231 RepID=A0A1Y1HSS8_KLENI|nr:hypothetical protein KFL_000870210 [Klebsormidium nitens]|eukprot:GAQ81685.1 hypothetical protein KFL_000870210 [Klebsormidium nitens]
MRAVLCSSISAPLYCTPARNGGTVYWIAHTLSPINERAVRATGVSGISGDAVLVESAEYGPLQLARFLPGSSAGGKTTPPPETASLAGSCVHKRATGNREELPESDTCEHVECSHKRGLSEHSGSTPVLESSCEETPGSKAHSHPGKRLRGSQCERDASVELQQRQARDSLVHGTASACELDSLVEVGSVLSAPSNSSGVARVSLNLSTETVHSIESNDSDHCSHLSVAPSSICRSAGAHSHHPDSTYSHHSEGASAIHTSTEHLHQARSDIEHLSPAHNSRCEISSGVAKPSCEVGVENEGRAFSQGRSMDSLSIGELQMVFSFLGFSDLSTASAVCKLWRMSIAEDEPLLKSLVIRRRMFQPAIAPPAPRRTKFLCGTHPLPFVLIRAAEAGNVPAMVLVAEEMERQGQRPKALDWWKKAARKGDQGSQYRIGEAYYRGDSEWPQDGEEALIWLNRAAKFAHGDAGLSAAAGLLLGYMHLDGEGIAAPNNTEAVRWFRFAAELGNREAEKTLGWLWNTGQF